MRFTDYILDKYGFDINDKSYKTQLLPKGTILTDYGKVEQFAYFVEDGILEVEITNQVDAYTLDFIFPSEIVTSYVSYLEKAPSDICIKCLTECKITVLPLDPIYQEEDAGMKEILIGEISRYFLKRVNREKEFFLYSAKERYKNILENKPQLIQNIPLYKLASYLKITPESLSRIRKEIS